MLKAEHARRLAALEERRKPRKVGKLVLTEELELEIVAGSAWQIGGGVTPEGTDEEVWARVTEEAVEAYARGGLAALAEVNPEVAEDAEARMGFVRSMGLMMLPGFLKL